MNDPLGRFVKLILFVIFVIVVCQVAAVAIRDGSNFIGWFFRHLFQTLENAGLDPDDPRKFGNFVELFLIAIFVGWAWRRFKR